MDDHVGSSSHLNIIGAACASARAVTSPEGMRPRHENSLHHQLHEGRRVLQKLSDTNDHFRRNARHLHSLCPRTEHSNEVDERPFSICHSEWERGWKAQVPSQQDLVQERCSHPFLGFARRWPRDLSLSGIGVHRQQRRSSIADDGLAQTSTSGLDFFGTLCKFFFFVVVNSNVAPSNLHVHRSCRDDLLMLLLVSRRWHVVGMSEC